MNPDNDPPQGATDTTPPGAVKTASDGAATGSEPPAATIGHSYVGKGLAPAESVSRIRRERPALPDDILALESVDSGRGASNRYVHQGVLLGSGGSADVKLVHDQRLGCTLAMKILRPKFADNESARNRLMNEARVTANLQHPGIVAVHDIGFLPDTRPFFTMKYVKGEELGDSIKRLHRVTGDPDAQRLALRATIEKLVRVCEAVGYAHSKRIVHRDIKPANLMVGPFGEVLVMDWGLAMRLAPANDDEQLLDSDPLERAMGLLDSPRESSDPEGTVSYMSPEQARGDIASMSFTSDVYALGAVLYQVLAGRAPYAGRRDKLEAVKAGPPKSLESFGSSELRPEALRTVCEKAMQREPANRYADAGALRNALQDWLNDAQRRERALSHVRSADKLLNGDGTRLGIAQLHAEVERLREQAAEMLDKIEPYEIVEKKREAWTLEDRAAEHEHNIAVLEALWRQLLRSALNEVSDLPEAHNRLAHYFLGVARRARERRDHKDLKRAETLLSVHNRYGQHDAYLRGDASLTLHTAPEAEVTLYRYEPELRRLVQRFDHELGRSPIDARTLPHGSYLLILQAAGHEPVRYPVLLTRGDAWTGIRPSEHAPTAIPLPPAGSLEADEVYVAPGWCLCGGGPEDLESLPRRNVWLDGFVIMRHPVTRSEYVAFLNALLDAEREEEALRHAPRHPSNLEAGKTDVLELAWPRDKAGRFQLDPDIADPQQGRWPVTLVDWHGACQYADWKSEQSGRRWRLPSHMERPAHAAP